MHTVWQKIVWFLSLTPLKRKRLLSLRRLKKLVYSHVVYDHTVRACREHRFSTHFVRSKNTCVNPEHWQDRKVRALLIFSLGIIILVFQLFTPNPLLSLYGVIKILEFSFFAFYIAQHIRNQVNLVQIGLLFAFSGMLESLIALFQYLNEGSLGGWLYLIGERTFTGSTPGIANASLSGELVLRPYGTLPHPNVLAGYLLIVLLYSWFYLKSHAQRSIRIFGIASIVLCSAGVFLTLSRVAILLWLILGISSTISVLRKKLKAKAKSFFWYIRVLVVLLLTFSIYAHDVVLRFLGTSLDEEAIVQRLDLISSTWTMMMQHPIFGVGLLHFIPSLAPLQPPLSIGLYLQPVHNILLLYVAETGLLGLGLVLLFGTALLEHIKRHRQKVFVISLLSVVFITGMVDHYWLTVQQGQLLFATIIGISFATIKR